MNPTRLPRPYGSFALAASVTLTLACVSVQDFTDVAPTDDGGAADDAPPSSTNDGGFGTTEPAASSPMRWQWENPLPTGRTLRAIGGRSGSDLWAAGEGGTIVHFDGTKWDKRHLGDESTTYFAVGSRDEKATYFAGTDGGGKSFVLRHEGAEWVEAYSFAGSAFRRFSHGPGRRLFALAGTAILELEDDGTWAPTDVTAAGEHGDAVDVWVADDGEAWGITGKGWDIPTAQTTVGAWLLHLAPGSRKWTIAAPPASVPKRSLGLALSGSGRSPCAFYTGEDGATPLGFLRYESGAWRASAPSKFTYSLAGSSVAHGSRMACFDNGAGVMVHGATLLEGSLDSEPTAYERFAMARSALLGAVSFDGKRAFAVGESGTFVARTGDDTTFRDVVPTHRGDLLGLGVGLDKSVLAVNAFGPNRSSGGEVLFWTKGSGLAPESGGSTLGPRLPKDVAVVGAKDAWIVSDDVGMLGVTRWTGAFSVTSSLASGSVSLAVFAPAKDDVWVLGEERCPDPILDPGRPCSKPQAPRAFHYDGATWKAVGTGHRYAAVHGSAPDDVWLVGDGAAHWDGTKLTRVDALSGAYRGVWASAKDRVWLWGASAVRFDGARIESAHEVLGTSPDWNVQAIAESAGGHVFVVATQAVGSEILWFDPAQKKLLEHVGSDLTLSAIRGRGDELWALGEGGAAVRFAPWTSKTSPR